MEELQEPLPGAIGAGRVRIRSGASALGGSYGVLSRYFERSVEVTLDGSISPLPFKLGEIDEISLSKSSGALLDRLGGMKTFLAFLADWAEANGTAGRTVTSEPDAGPGTMYWRAL